MNLPISQIEHIGLTCGTRAGSHCVAPPLLPRRLRVDHGPEFTSLAMDAWVHQRGVKLAFTQPGEPTKSAYIENFNGKFRDECLNDNWFTSLHEAHVLIE